jgi:hypothetical protein
MMTTHELQTLVDDIRLAGYVDGEGCIHVARNNGSYKWTLVIASGDLPNLKLLQAHASRASLREYKRRPNTNVRCYQISLCNSEAIACLEKLLPFLLAKAPQALAAIDSYSSYKLARLAKDHELARRIGEQAYLDLRDLKEHNHYEGLL